MTLVMQSAHYRDVGKIICDMLTACSGNMTIIFAQWSFCSSSYKYSFNNKNGNGLFQTLSNKKSDVLVEHNTKKNNL